MKTYERGDDFKGKNETFRTYGITEFESAEKDGVLFGEHTNKIEVYGDLKLRDRIIKLLNKGK